MLADRSSGTLKEIESALSLTATAKSLGIRTVANLKEQSGMFTQYSLINKVKIATKYYNLELIIFFFK